MMGYQTGTLTGIKTWMVERGIRDRNRCVVSVRGKGETKRSGRYLP